MEVVLLILHIKLILFKFVILESYEYVSNQAFKGGAGILDTF